MKKLLLGIFLSIVFYGNLVLAAGTCTGTNDHDNYVFSGTFQYTISCTADSSDGSYPTYTIPTTYTKDLKRYGFYIWGYEYYMGSTAPDALTVKLIGSTATKDLAGLDLATMNVTKVVTDTARGRFTVPWPSTDEALVVTPTGNSTNSAVFTLTLYGAR